MKTFIKQEDLELFEKEMLIKLGLILKGSLNDFSTMMDRSLRYLEHIVIPLIMASKSEKSYNPFSEIIERYIQHILIHKFEKEGYYYTPLKFSSDICLEGKDFVLNIEVKTASLDNTSDFQNTINVGLNQTSHPAKFINLKNFKIFPSLPPYYMLDRNSKKLNLTYGLLFIYPSYRDIMEEITISYNELYKIFHKKIKIILRNKVENRKIPVLVENTIRGLFIHNQRLEITFNKSEEKILKDFSSKVRNFIKKIRNRNIKPIAIVAIAIPNGLLLDYYEENFVSGKSFGESARYHYNDEKYGIVFKVLKDKKKQDFPRVIFIDINEQYKK